MFTMRRIVAPVSSVSATIAAVASAVPAVIVFAAEKQFAQRVVLLLPAAAGTHQKSSSRSSIGSSLMSPCSPNKSVVTAAKYAPLDQEKAGEGP